MTQETYDRLLEKLGELTPLKSDCGRLCGGACCEASDDLEYVTLLPGEKELLPTDMKSHVTAQEFPGMGLCDAFCCPGSCDRRFRPLMCRIFPLAPRIKADGTVAVRMDARGLPVCPLTRERIAALDRRFVQAVREIFALMMSDPELREYLALWSNACDLFENPII